MKVNLVDKRAKLSLHDTIKFQLITHCYLNQITMSDSQLNCLTLLGVKGEYDLAEFCNLASSENIFKTTQSVRNAIVKMEKEGFIVKDGKGKKRIFLNPDIKVQTKGSILLDFKFAHIATEEV